MKIAVHAIVVLVLAFGWVSSLSTGSTLSKEAQKDRLIEMENNDATQEEMDKVENEMNSDSNENSFGSLLLSFLTAGYVGILFVIYVLPAIAHKATHAVYDSGEEVEEDAMHSAHSKVAQGDYDGAIADFYEAASKDEANRLPYVEIAKLQRVTMHDSDAAIKTLTDALTGQEWEENDAAFLLFRLAEIYHEDKHDLPMACSIMQQVIDQFPSTRHSANAQHKLQEWKAL